MTSLIKHPLRTSLLGLGLSAGLLASPLASACPATPFIGGMCAFGGNFAPRDWAMAQGQLLPINQHTALFSLIGTTYGGDGRTTFQLPDLRGRSAVGQGTGPGLYNVRMGQRGGAEFVTLNITQMPSHGHSASTSVTVQIDSWSVTANLVAQDAVGSTASPSSAMLAQNNASSVYSSQAPNIALAADAIEATASASMSASATTNIGLSGSGQSHENRMPYLTVNWIIALQGLYPSRS
ncbi:phage tail protein [Fluctibacter halophilus]|nr:tail fiber protein [Aestuariibacter halophilus]